MSDINEEDSLTALLAIFGIREKAALVEHCRDARVRKGDLANLILAAEVADIGLSHIPIFQHHHPTHLDLTPRDLETMASAAVGPLKGGARKAFGKVSQMFEERRLFCAHMFWPPAQPGDWHLFYFDQRDISSQSHWEHGSHIHLMNMLTHPRLEPNDLLRQLRSAERPRLGGSLHIRFVE